MNNKILLINPPIYDFAAYDLFFKPLGLLYVGGYIRDKGYDIELLDTLDRNDPLLLAHHKKLRSKANGTGKFHSSIVEKPAILKHIPRHYRRYGLDENLIRQKLNEHRDDPPRAILITSMMTYWYPAVAEMIKLVREVSPNTPIALGGVYATLMPAHAMEVCQPDKLFVGSKLTPVLSWLDEICDIQRKNKPEEPKFEDWPLPAYDLYPKLDYLTMITSLGCPNHCDYCASKNLQPKFQQMPPDKFIEQLDALLPLLDDQQPYNIAFMDDALLANNTKRIIPIARAIAKKDIKFNFHCPNGLHCRFISLEVATLMHEVGFKMVRLSYEAAGESTAQKASDNKVTDQHFRDAVNNLINAGFDPAQLDVYILIGLVDQEFAEIKRSADAVHAMGLKIRLCQFTPIPGSKMFDRACDIFDLDKNEPLLHNNSILATRKNDISEQCWNDFKDYVHQLNSKLI